MDRVLVIGSGGSGKSMLAAELARRTALPLIHLDPLYWRPGWVETPPEEWREIVESLIAGEKWIMDGNYGGTMEVRLDACDTVIFMDLPRSVCLRQVLQRRVRYHRRCRPDMTPGCEERLSWAFLRWIWEYPAARRPRILKRLGELRSNQRFSSDLVGRPSASWSLSQTAVFEPWNRNSIMQTIASTE